ncbi:MAG TPA: sulfotransferase [Solirubrobacteraceae bacterium]|nr:sulfotransferase [Solirubrobacteraceae bacterium]
MSGTPRVPDFFIVGHEKCGTTALYRMLRSHPDVFMPDFKEPRYFAPEVRDNVPRDHQRADTLDDYQALFAAAQPKQLVGEASPQYLRFGATAGRIAQMQPDARIIAILREPASFLRSVHLQAVHAGREPQRELAKALALEPLRREGKKLPRGFSSPAWVLYSDFVRYREQLRSYEEQFSRDRMLILIYDDYRADNEATVGQVLRFLELDPDIAIEPVRTGPSRTTVRFPRLHPLSRKLRVARHRPELAGPVSRAVLALSSRPLRVLWRRFAYETATPADEQLMQQLRRRFKPEVEALSEYLDRDLVSLWHYEEL